MYIYPNELHFFVTFASDNLEALSNYVYIKWFIRVYQMVHHRSAFRTDCYIQ